MEGAGAGSVQGAVSRLEHVMDFPGALFLLSLLKSAALTSAVQASITLVGMGVSGGCVWRPDSPRLVHAAARKRRLQAGS